MPAFLNYSRISRGNSGVIKIRDIGIRDNSNSFIGVGSVLRIFAVATSLRVSLDRG